MAMAVAVRVTAEVKEEVVVPEAHLREALVEKTAAGA